MGGEWWLRRKKPNFSDNSVLPSEASSTTPEPFTLMEGSEPPSYKPTDDIQGVVKARASSSSVSGFSFD